MTTVNMTSMGSPVLLKRRLAKKRRPLDGVDNCLPLLHLTYNTTATLFQSVPPNRGFLIYGLYILQVPTACNLRWDLGQCTKFHPVSCGVALPGFPEEVQNSKLPNPD